MLFLDPRGTCLLSSRLPMKIDDSMPAGAVRTRPAASAAASGTVPAKPTAADVADFLGISEAELTPNVQQGLVRLMDEVDRLRRELDIKDRRIADLERLSDEDPLAPVLNRRAFVRELTRMISAAERSEEHTSELQSRMRISYAVFCLKKKNEQL